MRTTGRWLLAVVGCVATIVFCVIIAEQFVSGTYTREWGVAGGIAALLAVVTLGAAGHARSVRLRNGRELPKAAIAARIAARAVDMMLAVPGVFVVLRSLYRAGHSRLPKRPSE